MDFTDEKIFIYNQNIFLGGAVKHTLDQLLNEGDITEAKHKKFLHAVHCYFKSSLAYILGKFPLQFEQMNPVY